MDINALQVFNSMYRLGITNEEFRAIEEEQKHTGRTGLSIKCVKKGYCICVSHDEKHEIVIKKINYKVNLANTRILFKTLITFEDLPEEIYVLHQIAQYRTSDSEIKHIATNLEELKDRVCDRFADEYPKALGEIYDYYRGWQDTDEDVKEKERMKQELITEQLKALFWLFGEDYGSFRGEMARKNIPRIVKVFSRNNRRVAIFQINEKYEKERGSWTGGGGYRFTDRVDKTTLKLKTYTPRDERYNYVSPNREVFFGGGEIWIDDNLFEKLGHAELEILSKRFSDSGYAILNADKYNQMKQSIRLELMSAKRREQEEGDKEKLARKIDEQFKRGRVVRQGIEFRRTSMSYGGVAFKADKLGVFIVSQNIIFQEQPNFTQIYQDYIDYILEADVSRNYYNDNMKTEIRFEGKIKISIGKIKITIFKSGKNFFIELKGKKPRRINKDDVSAVLKNAIDYTNRPQEYEDYLSFTSKVNLKLQQALEQGGLKFELSTSPSADNAPLIKENYGKILLTLPLTRRKGKNYVVIKKREYGVKNTQALFDLGKESNRYYGDQGLLQRTIKLLYKSIGGITPEVIGGVISQGKREYAKMQARIRAEEEAKVKNSKEFLHNAIRLTNARDVDGGYMVRGLSGTVYFVDKEDSGVWTVREKGRKLVNDKYLCMIDEGTDKSTKWGRNDAIAKRLMALSKDSVVASEIYQRGDRVDTFWMEIATDNKVGAV